MLRKLTAGTSSRLTIVDHEETYGRHLLSEICVDNISTCLDIGCGHGNDLMRIKERFPSCKLIGIDYGGWNKSHLNEIGIEQVSLDIEKDLFPFDDESIDFIIANQVLEHTKEIYFINNEIFRVLKTGGVLFLGVPNVLSLHNRILGLFGIHPTCSKMISAHVRSFSKNDTLLFYNSIAGECLRVEKYMGSQFYPFPKIIARPLSRLLPTMAFSNFYLIRKFNVYNGEFIKWISNTFLETNYYKGPNAQ